MMSTKASDLKESVSRMRAASACVCCGEGQVRIDAGARDAVLDALEQRTEALREVEPCGGLCATCRDLARAALAGEEPK